MKTAAYALIGVLALAAAPANGQLPGLRGSPERFSPPIPFNGEACQVGGEVTACPKLPVDRVMEDMFSDLVHDRYKRDVTVSYCITARGKVDEAVVVSDTSGTDKAHDNLLRAMGYLRFHPGKINGKPAKMCGFTSLFQFRPRKWSDDY